MAQAIKQEDGSKRTVEKLLGRRKLKKNYEYEVQWKGCLETTWVSDERLKELGFQKMMTEIDAKEAARAGMALKPLTQANIEKHLQDLGLDPEFGTHSQMRGLSGAFFCHGIELEYRSSLMNQGLNVSVSYNINKTRVSSEGGLVSFSKCLSLQYLQE